MKSNKRSGFTLLGFIFALIIGLFFAYIAMRLIPMYLEYHALNQAMNNIAAAPEGSKLSPGRIRERIIRSLYVSYATDNIKKEHIRITRDRGVKVQVVYEVRKPMMGNIDVVGSFEKTVKLR
jgi:hypothetical protein